MTAKNRSELLTQYEQIRDELMSSANTAVRVGQAFIDGLDSTPVITEDSLIPDGGTYKQVLKLIPVTEKIQCPKFVTTTTGTDIWIPGDSHTLGSENLTYVGLLHSIDAGENFITYEPPTLDQTKSPVIVIREPQTNRTFLLSHGIQSGSFGVGPQWAFIAEITSTNPLTIGAYTQVSSNRIEHASAPGDGYIYIATDRPTRYNVATGIIEANDNAYTIQMIHVDQSTSKYPDGFRRVYASSTSGIHRISLENFALVESTIVPDGFYTMYMNGFTIDGVNNHCWTVNRNSVDNRYHIVKTSLQPYQQLRYSVSIEKLGDSFYGSAYNNAIPVSFVHDTVTGISALIWQTSEELTWPSGSNYTYLSLFRDNGVSLTQINEILLPEAAGCATYTDTYNRPVLSVIDGNLYIPLNGGRGVKINEEDYLNYLSGVYTFPPDYSGLSSVLKVDLSSINTPILTPITYQEKAVWQEMNLETGDLKWIGENLFVFKLFGQQLTKYSYGFMPVTEVDLLPGQVLTYTGNTWTPHYPKQIIYPESNNQDVLGVNGGLIGPSSGTYTANIYKRYTQSYTIPYELSFYRPGYTANTSSSFTLTSAQGHLIYGLSGSATGLSSYVSHSAHEHIDLLYNGTRLECVNRWRPWEAVSITTAGTTTVNGGKVIVTCSGTGTRIINLPSIRNHGDEIIIKDFAGNAQSNPIQFRGNSDEIDGFSSSTLFTIPDNYGWVWLRYDTVRSSWLIIAKSGQQTAVGSSLNIVKQLAPQQITRGNVTASGGTRVLTLAAITDGKTITYDVAIDTLTGTVRDFYRAIIIVYRATTSTIARTTVNSPFDSANYVVSYSLSTNQLLVTLTNNSGTAITFADMMATSTEKDNA